jgi:predicted HTH domain antitoxin
MPLTIPDEVLKQAGLTQREALIEFACRLFDAERIDVHQAARIAGLDRYAFEEELRKRGLAVYRVTEEDLKHDLEAFRKLGI